MTQTNTNATPMTKPFSTNPKLADWVPSEQQIQTITAARDIWDLVPEEEGDETNKSCINILNVYSHLHPEITDPQQLADTAGRGCTTSSRTASAIRQRTDA